MTLNKIGQNKKVNNEEEGYRKYYLNADISQSKLGILLFAVPIIGFVFNDYLFFYFIFDSCSY